MYRIKRRDKLNWVIERWVEEHVAERGPHKGKPVPAKWDENSPVGYFNTLRSAAVRLLDEQIATELDGKAWTGQDLCRAIDKATAKVVAAVAKAEG